MARTATERLRALLRQDPHGMILKPGFIATTDLEQLMAEAGVQSLDYARHVANGEGLSVWTA